MKVHHTDFPGMLIIEPDVFDDERGYFFESYNKLKFSNNRCRTMSQAHQRV